MAGVEFTRQYATEAELMYQVAKSSNLFDTKAFDDLVDQGMAEDYAYAVAGTLTKTEDNFNKYYYDILDSDSKFRYLINEYYQDKNETATDETTGETYNVYQRNKEYIDYKIDEAIDLQTYESLNWFQKTINTVGGFIGDALNELVLGTIEGLTDLTGLALGALGEAVGIKGSADFMKDVVAMDATGVQANREALARYKRAYTAIDKSKVLYVADEVITGIAKMAPMVLPGGKFIYFGAMAGATAEEAVRANPDINYLALLAYTGAVTGVEFATEKLSSVIFGGSAVDKLLFKTSGSRGASWITRMGMDFLSEGFEESISEFADSVLYTAMVDPNAPLASFEECLYAGLIGGLTGAVMSGVDIATTQRGVIMSDGMLVGEKYAKELGLKGKTLTKSQTLYLKEKLASTEKIMSKSAVADLQRKYSGETLSEIQTKHADEYKKATATDLKIKSKLAESALGLNKIMQMAGVEGFKKASEIANYTIEKRAELARNYTNKLTGTTDAIRKIQKAFNDKNPGSSVTINENPSVELQRIADHIKKSYGVDVYFGTFGEENGQYKNHNLNIDAKTVVVDEAWARTASADAIMNKAVNQQLIDSLKTQLKTLSDAQLSDIINQVGFAIPKDIQSLQGKEAREAQINALAQALWFDKSYSARLLTTQQSTFSKIYNFFDKIKTGIENLKAKKSNADKIKYSEVLKAMDRYRSVIGEKIGNVSDAKTIAKKLKLTPEQTQQIIDSMKTDYTNEHYTWLTADYTYDTEQRVSAEKDLLSKRALNMPGLPLDYKNVFNPTYYGEKSDFVKSVMNLNPSQSFEYNLQEYMINNFGFVINQKMGCLMEVIDFSKVTSKQFDTDAANLTVDSNAMSKYTNLSQVFNEDFNKSFIKDGVNALADVELQFVVRQSDNAIQGGYALNPETNRPQIKIYLKDGATLNIKQVQNLIQTLWHEAHHAVADIEGLPNGTSTNAVKTGLQKLSNDQITKLAKLRMDAETYEQYKNDRTQLENYLAYGIYNITDGEYAAEATPSSKVRGKDTKDATRLKTGALLNKSGFTADGLTLTGYGIYDGFVLECETTRVEPVEYTGKGLKPQSEVISERTLSTEEKGLQEASKIISREANVTMQDYIQKAGFKGLVPDDFSVTYQNHVETGDLTRDNLIDMLNTNSIGSKDATNAVIKELYPNNQNIKTIQDVEKAKTTGLAYANTYYKLMSQQNAKVDATEAHSYSEIKAYVDAHLNDSITTTSKKTGEKTTIKVSKHLLNAIEKISDSASIENSRATEIILNNDPNYSKQSTDQTVKDIRNNEIGEKIKQRNLDDMGQGNSDIDKRSVYETIEDTTAQQQFLGEEITETKATPKEIQNRAEKAVDKVISDWLTTKDVQITQTQEDLTNIKKRLQEHPEISTNILSVDRLENNLKKNITEQNKLQIANKLYSQREFIDSIFGEGATSKTMSDLNLKRSSYYTTEIKKLKKSISERADLTIKEKALLNQSTQNFTETEYKSYMTRLQEINNRPKSKQVEKTTDQETKIVSELKPQEPIIDQQRIDDAKRSINDKLSDIKKLSQDDFDSLTKEYAQLDKSDLSQLTTFGEQLTDKYGDLIKTDMKKSISQMEEIKRGMEAPKTTEEAIKDATPSETVKPNKPSTVTDAILNFVAQGKVGESDVQYVEPSSKEYQQLQYNMINNHADVFVGINDSNYSQIREELVKSGNKQALTLFDLFCIENKGAFNKDIRQKINDAYAKGVSEAGQQLALQRRRVATRNTISDMVSHLAEDGYEVSISDEVVQSYDERLKEKDKYIQSLTERIEQLRKELKDTSLNAIEKQVLMNELQRTSETKLVMEEGTNVQIMDWILNNTDTLNERAKIQKDFVEKLMQTIERADGKDIGFYVKTKDDVKAFPEMREKVLKTLKKLKSYRMTAMLSSPVTWVRNWIGNQTMRGLNGMTNALERLISKGVKFDEGQMRYQETRGGKELSKYIGDTYGDYIMSIIRGEDTKFSDEKKAEYNRLKRVADFESANAIQKAFSKMQDIVDWGLNTGPLGDEPILFRDIVNNMGNLVASNTEYLLKGIRTEYETLQQIKNPSAKQKTRMDVLNKALSSKSSIDIFNALSSAETERLFDNAKTRSMETFFKNPNWLSKTMSNLATKSPVMAEIVSWVLPFPKVAANILTTAYKYSPLGFINGFVELSKYKQLKAKGLATGFEQSGYIRAFSKATVGTFTLIAGAIAAALGWVDIDDDDYMGPALNIGGKLRIGLSDLAPAGTVFSTAAAFVWAQNHNKSGFKYALDTIYDNTMLGNIDNIFRYGSLQNYVTNIPISLVSQYVPSVMKLINSTVFKSSKKDTSDSSYFMKMMKTLASYVPGLANLVPNKIDPYTGGKVYSTGTDKWFLNFIFKSSPVQVKWTGGGNELEQEAKHLGQGTSGLNGTFNINGTDYKLQGSDKENMAKFRANYVNEHFRKIKSGAEKVTIENEQGRMITTTWARLDDAQRKKVLSRLYSKASDYTKVKWWVSQGHTYVISNRDTYHEYAKALGSSAGLSYREKWNKSKFID